MQQSSDTISLSNLSHLDAVMSKEAYAKASAKFFATIQT